jgi:two-component system, LuxR family, response regulator FixJ
MTHHALKVVVVDDDDGVRLALQQLLRAAGFQTLGFATAEALLGAMDGHDADCLVADINLPGASGVALSRSLAAQGRSLPTVLISARDDPTTLALVRSAGSLPFLRKPFSDEELLEAIALAMRNT